MWVAVNRLTTSGRELGPDQRITPEQALLACTREAATVRGIEDQVGTLAPGMVAGFVVLSDNPLTVDPLKIRDIKVDATVMNGEITCMADTGGPTTTSPGSARWAVGGAEPWVRSHRNGRWIRFGLDTPAPSDTIADGSGGAGVRCFSPGSAPGVDRP